MEEVLKEILEKLNIPERKTDTGFAIINERIGILDSGNKKEFSELHKNIDSISGVVARTSEDIVDLKGKVEKQDVEIRVIKGGAANALWEQFTQGLLIKQLSYTLDKFRHEITPGMG